MFDEATLISAQKLAYFLISCPRSYLLLVVDAAERAATQSRRQEEHFAEPPKIRPNCVNWKPKHLLQLWICESAKKYERNFWPREELNGETRDQYQQTLLVRFVRDVVTWRMIELSTFHATIGMTEILHGYDKSLQGSPEYYWIRHVLDPGEVKKGTDYYRRWYGALLKYLVSADRFGSLIKIEKDGVKNRICSRSDSHNFDSLVRGMLREFFTLWESDHPDDGELEKSYYFGESITQHAIAETIRAHRLLCPECFFKITSSLKICEPSKRLQIPQFAMSDEFYKGPPAGEKLSDEDALNNVPLLFSSLKEKAKRRAEYRPGIVRLYADGKFIGIWDLIEPNQQAIYIDSKHRLIEVYTDDDLLLATHFISYDDLEEKEQSGVWIVKLEGGQQLHFIIRPNKTEVSQNPESSVLKAEYHETYLNRKVVLAFKRCLRILKKWCRKLDRPFILIPAITMILLTIALVPTIIYKWTQDIPETLSLPSYRWVRGYSTPKEYILEPDYLALMEKLRDKNPRVRKNTIITLGNSNRASSVVPMMIGLLKDSSWDVRCHAAWAIFMANIYTDTHTVNPTEAVPALIEGLKDQNVYVRYCVAMTLEIYGDEAKEAIPALIIATGDEDAMVRGAAKHALGAIGRASGQ